MEKQKEPHPEWATRHRTKGTELRKINNRYYLYEYKTVYDEKKKKPRKVSGQILGSITEKNGFKPSPKRLLKENALTDTSHIQCKEYGVVKLITSKFNTYYEALKKIFGTQADQLIAIAYCRFVHRCPLKHIPHLLEASFLPEELGINKFNNKKASQILNNLGKDKEKMLAYMRSFVTPNDHILMDFTNIFSHSRNINLAQKGYNSSMQYDPQLNLLYIYSANNKMPIYYRLLPGNIREVSAFKNSILEAGLHDATIVADKGFYSIKNVAMLNQANLQFILPLRRNNRQIDYTSIIQNTFTEKAVHFQHQKRIIWCEKQRISTNQYLYLFLDDELKVREQKDYLFRVQTHPEAYKLENFHKRKHSQGTLALLSNTDQKPDHIYQTYKSRMSIEVFFDSMKNVLDIDHTYMQNEDTLQGWMFINHLTLQWYQHLYIELKEKNLLRKISVGDYIKFLSNIKKVKINNQWYLNECTSSTQKFINKVGVEIYPPKKIESKSATT